MHIANLLLFANSAHIPHEWFCMFSWSLWFVLKIPWNKFTHLFFTLAWVFGVFGIWSGQKKITGLFAFCEDIQVPKKIALMTFVYNTCVRYFGRIWEAVFGIWNSQMTVPPSPQPPPPPPPCTQPPQSTLGPMAPTDLSHTLAVFGGAVFGIWSAQLLIFCKILVLWVQASPEIPYLGHFSEF